eukprot:2623391-Rhodomonas_salina.1
MGRGQTWGRIVAGAAGAEARMFHVLLEVNVNFPDGNGFFQALAAIPDGDDKVCSPSRVTHREHEGIAVAVRGPLRKRVAVHHSRDGLEGVEVQN